MPIAIEGAIDLGVLAIIAAIFCLIAALYLVNAFAPSFPIIGNVFKDYIGDPIIGWLIFVAVEIAQITWNINVGIAVRSWGEFLQGGGDLTSAIRGAFGAVFSYSESTVSSHLTSLVNWAFGRDLNGAINLVNFVASGAATDARNALQTALNLEPLVAGLANDVAAIKSAIGGISAGEISLIQSAVNDAESKAASALQGVADITNKSIPLINATVSTLNGQVQNVIHNTTILAGDVATLTSDIPGIQAGEQAAEAAVGAIGQRVDGIESDVAKVLPLAAITALGAVAIENIINLAEDPCLCLGAEGDYAWVAAVAADVLITQGP